MSDVDIEIRNAIADLEKHGFLSNRLMQDTELVQVYLLNEKLFCGHMVPADWIIHILEEIAEQKYMREEMLDEDLEHPFQKGTTVRTENDLAALDAQAF